MQNGSSTYFFIIHFLHEFISQTAGATPSDLKQLFLLAFWLFLMFLLFTFLVHPREFSQKYIRRLHKIFMQQFFVFVSLAAFDKDEHANHGRQHGLVHIHLVRAHQNSARDI